MAWIWRWDQYEIYCFKVMVTSVGILPAVKIGSHLSKKMINDLSTDDHQMRFTIISYGGAILIISAILHYLVVPGIENCGSMEGIISTYMSKDYSLGCQLLSDIQTGSVAGEVSGAVIIAWGILLKPRFV